MNKQEFKDLALAAIDDLAGTIKDTGEFLYRHPELGYKETLGTAHVAELLGNAGYRVETGIAVTGVLAEMAPRNSGPWPSWGNWMPLYAKSIPMPIPTGWFTPAATISRPQSWPELPWHSVK